MCQIRRNDAEARIRALVEGESVPIAGRDVGDLEPEAEPAYMNVEEQARDQIMAAIGERFPTRRIAA